MNPQQEEQGRWGGRECTRCCERVSRSEWQRVVVVEVIAMRNQKSAACEELSLKAVALGGTDPPKTVGTSRPIVCS